MTDQEKQEFIKKVKGKKIRKGWFNAGDYFVPDREYDERRMCGVLFNKNNKPLAKAQYYIGLGLSSIPKDGFWTLVENHEKNAEPSVKPFQKGFKITLKNRTTALEQISVSSCQHEWKNYHGFTESYQYCEKCGEKKGVLNNESI